MFRNPNEEVKEEKVESTVLYRSKWEARFHDAVALPDGIHLVATLQAASLLANDQLMTWNIKDRQMLWSCDFSEQISAIAVLKNNDFVIADNTGAIHRYQINAQGVPSFIEKFPTTHVDISAMSELEDGSLAIAYEDNIVSIWDLAKKEKLKTFLLGNLQINAMDTQSNNLLLIANENGCVFVYNLKDDTCAFYTFGNFSIKSLVVLPDNTIVFLGSDAILRHYDLTNSKVLSLQPISDNPSQLTAMPNGWIGCINSNSFLLFEPSWVRDYVNVNADSAEKKRALTAYLLPPLTEIVLGYAGNITLFNSPKMPHKKESVLENDSPRPKAP
jgi:hypothetical protein